MKAGPTEQDPLVTFEPKVQPRSRPRISILHLLLLITGLFMGLGLAWWNVELFVPDYLEGRRMHGVSGCSANLTRIGMAIEAYSQEYGGLPRSQYDLVPNYLKELPTCPAAQRMSYRTAFGPYAGNNRSSEPFYFLVECCGENHGQALLSPDFPAYDSKMGLIYERGW